MGSPPPSVCFVSHTAGMGGAERSLLEAVDALSREGVRCQVVLPGRGPLGAALEERGIPWAVVPYTWWMGAGTPPWKRAVKLLANLAAAPAVALRARRWGCHLVYTNSLTVSVGALAARLLRLPHVWHLHEFGREHHGLVFELGEAFSLRLVDRLSAACVMTSHALAARYRPHLPTTRVHVVYQSVSLSNGGMDPALPRTGAFRCVIVGALQRGKGQEDAIRAVARLAGEGVDVDLCVVGGGEAEEARRLRSLADASGAGERIFFTGQVEDVSGYLRGSDVVLVCSRFEAFGRTTVEGMLAGKPVVGARSGATAELVEDGVTGYLYEPGDDRALAERIRHLCSHPDDARAMGEAARRWAAPRFAPERYGRELAALVRDTSCEEGAR